MSVHDPIRRASTALKPQKPAYRALVLDAEKKVLRTEVLFAQTDAEALSLAAALAWQCDVELWDGLRFIEQIAAGTGRA
ncbi:hypothetical protein HCU64_23630 [Methylobacterium sp. C25]|uniref:hypothetical protein n=1 Tax=Methylobacterium sp. C25 TaxID=2721622 RepID=UPI001F323B8C|nr:hypothetical protein [Methylobacterium sp. C25]MCE4226737.1 hypothetical protein [Methylobacterium sp. C25]